MLKEWAEGAYTDKNLRTLISLLGDSQQTYQFLSAIGGLINNIKYRREHDKSGKISVKERREIIAGISKKARSLKDGIEPISFNFWEPDNWGDRSHNDFHTQTAIQVTCVPGLKEGEPADDNFFLEVSSSLNELILRCEAALQNPALTPKRGDRSFEQALLDQFDLRLIIDYRLSFRCFPSTYEHGAYMRSVEVFYRSAGFPSANFFQRMLKLIKQNKKEFGEARAQNWKSIRNLHPNKYPE